MQVPISFRIREDIKIIELQWRTEQTSEAQYSEFWPSKHDTLFRIPTRILNITENLSAYQPCTRRYVCLYM